MKERYMRTTSLSSTKRWGRRYPWDSWFALGTFTLTKGTDYNGRTDTMMSQVRTQASKRNLKVSISCSDDGLSILVAVLTPGEVHP